jgi:glucokinase
MKTPSITIGLDIGGTRVKGGALDSAGKVLARAIEPTVPGQPLRALERQLNTLVDRLISETNGTLDGIGLSISGPTDPDIGCVYLPGKILGLDQHKTVPYLRKRWKVPVTADNDGRLACYAEWKAGAGRGIDNLLVITLGTGIGSGVVLDGRLLTDRHFQRGTQCGHMIIDINGPRCLTGAHGTGESIASVTALVHEVRSHAARGVPMNLPDKDIDFQNIVAALRGQDPIVTEIFDRGLDRFAAVLLNAFYAYTPDLILLAGGPTKASSLFLKKLTKRLESTAFRYPVGYKIPLRVAALGEDAGWIGAALRIKEIQ